MLLKSNKLITENGMFLANIKKSKLDETLKGKVYTIINRYYGIKVGEPTINPNMTDTNLIGLYIVNYKDYINDQIECSTSNIPCPLCEKTVLNPSDYSNQRVLRINRTK